MGDMDRDHFEAALDTVIAAHGRKVRAGIDAAACGTRWDWNKSRESDDAYLEAHEAFLVEVFAPPVAPLPVPFVFGWEVQESGGSRGRAITWRRGIQIRIASRGVTYVFAANADTLMLSSSAVVAGNDAELCSIDFAPLREGHSVRFREIDYSTPDPGPEDLVKIAIEACRAVALRLFAHGIDYHAASRPWPRHVPAFADIAKGDVARETAA
jgi:hypothetical protein